MKYFFLLVLISLLTACSSQPKYMAYDNVNKIGHSETKLAPGAYNVFAELPADMGQIDRDDYLLLRIAELCKKDGFDYYHYSTVILVEELGNNKKYSTTGLCTNEASRPSLNVVLNDNMLVTEATNPATSKILVGDIVQKVNGIEVKSVSDLKLVIHNFPSDLQKVKVNLIRKDKKIETEQIVGKTDQLMGPEFYRTLRVKFL